MKPGTIREPGEAIDGGNSYRQDCQYAKGAFEPNSQEHTPLTQPPPQSADRDVLIIYMQRYVQSTTKQVIGLQADLRSRKFVVRKEGLCGRIVL